MHVARTIEELRRVLGDARARNPTGRVGLVPTMGALHQGHRILIERAAAETDFAAVSIFVNPTQFNDPRDLERYPRTPDEDLEICRACGVSLVFLPAREAMFPDGATPLLHLSMPALTQTLCGPGRPGHFEGVLYIVARLFHLFGPDSAYFGRKDYQQYTIIRRMVAELDFPVEVVGHETVREDDGLALSSRNRLLSARAREHALLIVRSLRLAQKNYEDRGTPPEELAEIVADVISSGSENQVEYVDVVHPDTLERLSEIGPDLERFVIGTAVLCGGVRLIDNIEIPTRV